MSAELIPLYQAHVAELTREAEAALGATGFDALAIHSGSLTKRTEFDDQYWPLRPVPQFEHWAHLGWPECALHLVAGRRPRLLVVRDRSFWERPREPDWSFLTAALEVVELEAEQMKEQLAGRKTAFVGENRARAAEWGLEAINPAALMEQLDELRVFKTEYEVACLAEANRVAARGHQAVRDAFAAGVRAELELHLLFLGATGQDDSETPYKNIVAVGAAAAILHHVHYEKRPGNGRSLLLDAGASHRGYASDITRTYVAPGEDAGTQAFAGLIERMETMQRALVDSVRVGRPYEDLHDEAHQRLGALLVDAGLVKMSAEACVETGISRMFLPHGLGHSLGLTCHDAGCAKIRPRQENAWLRNTRVIEPDQVFTIEPGIYFIDTFMEELRAGPHASAIDWAQVEALKPFGGIRIEDDVVVLEDRVTTSKNLTRQVL